MVIYGVSRPLRLLIRGFEGIKLTHYITLFDTQMVVLYKISRVV